MIDHKISLQTFNRPLGKHFPLPMAKSSDTPVCNHCNTNQAEIFQESGKFWLHCWKEITCPNVQCGMASNRESEGKGTVGCGVTNICEILNAGVITYSYFSMNHTFFPTVITSLRTSRKY